MIAKQIVCRAFSIGRSTMASKTALVLLATNNEEMEVVIPTDILTRAGINVTMAGIEGQKVYKCSRNVKIVPDIGLEEAKGPYDIIVMPGGLIGAKEFVKSAAVGALLKEQEAAGRSVAAICAAPTAFLAHGVFIGKTVTCYPSVVDEMLKGNLYKYSKERVVVDGNLITSQGTGTAFEMAIEIVRHLKGDEAAATVKKPLLMKD